MVLIWGSVTMADSMIRTVDMHGKSKEATFMIPLAVIVEKFPIITFIMRLAGISVNTVPVGCIPMMALT